MSKRKDSTSPKDPVKTRKDKGKITIKNIIENYTQLEQSIVSQLKMCNDLHSTTTGTAREDIWLQLFESIIPRKFVIEHSIFIIDSQRHVSREVDLAIIDNSYTPYIFHYGRLKYVPIEAVAVVIECKSTKILFQEEDAETGKKEAYMTAWCSSIEQLCTSNHSITRMANGMVVDGIVHNVIKDWKSDPDNPKYIESQLVTSTQTSTRPIRIFCGYKTELSDANLKNLEKFFDFILIATPGDIKKSEKNKISIHIPKCEESLQYWYKKLNHYKPATNESLAIIENNILKGRHLQEYEVYSENDGSKISLLSFNFQLNQLLMILNNPLLFPHLAYVEMFNRKETEPLTDGRKNTEMHTDNSAL